MPFLGIIDGIKPNKHSFPYPSIKLTPKSIYSWLILVFALASPILIITPSGYFPHTGISTSLFSLSLLAYFSKPKNVRLQTSNLILFSITSITSLAISLYSNAFLTFINILATCFYGSALLFSSLMPLANIFQIATLPFQTIIKALNNKVRAFPDAPISQSKSTYSRIVGTTLALLLLLVLIPTLTSANPIFKSHVDNTIGQLNLKHAIKYITDNLLLYGFRILVFFILLFSTPNVLFGSTIKSFKKVNIPRFFGDTIKNSLSLPKITTILITGFFIFSQFQLYTASTETLKLLGYTNSQATREIFSQMIFVGLIIFGLIYNETNSTNRLERYSTYILMGIAYLLISFGLKSNIDYIAAFGLTHKRIYGLAVIATVYILFGLLTHNHYQQKSHEKIPSQMFTVIGLIIILINILNPDKLIAQNPPRLTDTDIDYMYMADSVPDGGHYRQLFSIVSNSSFPSFMTGPSAYPVLLYKIMYLQKKYQGVDLPSFSLNEYYQYQQVKDIPAQHLLDEYYRFSITPPTVLPTGNNNN